MTGFVVFGLPRSRTAWLAKFLSYREWHCGHDELRHCRSLDDVQAWFSQQATGTVETAGAPWWRLLERFAPDAKVVVVRRPVEEVLDSLTRLAGFDVPALTRAICQLDCKLDQIAARVPNVLSVQFADLEKEETCAALFEHCLPYKHDSEHWAQLAAVNVQINFAALIRYTAAYKPALDKLAAIAKQQVLAGMAKREPVAPDGITFQTEPFETWVQDGAKLFDEHLVQVGEAPGNWQNKNLPLMKKLHDAGLMQIMTARCNGRMFGYLMTVIGPSLVSEATTMGAHTTFYASPDVPGLGMKLQRAALGALKERGVDEVHFQAGVRGSGERIGAIYKRLGAEDAGQVFRLDLTGV